LLSSFLPFFLSSQILENLEALLTHLYIPMMEAQQTDSVQGAQAREELLQVGAGGGVD
jgi:hypothetical protein